MYTPQAFDVEDRTKLHQFIQQNSFATVISVNDSLPVASHLPLLFDDQAGEHGTLTGHMAKANSH
jgi:transcriptional regulator